MSFRANNYQQISLMDSFSGLTSREQKALENSWAKVFVEDIFPSINEEPFHVLYSNAASRPNTPVNVCIGSLIIKKIFHISDDEIVENLMLDPRYQYALHTTSYEEQPLSDKTLTRFRKRCYDYEAAYGIDLLKDCMTDLGGKIANVQEAGILLHRQSCCHRFFKDSMNRQEKTAEQITVIADGAYCGKENHDMAAKKNIRLVNTDLSGKLVDDILADFEFDESGKKVLRWQRYCLLWFISCWEVWLKWVMQDSIWI